jgi:hypothetical protein
MTEKGKKYLSDILLAIELLESLKFPLTSSHIAFAVARQYA